MSSSTGRCMSKERSSIPGKASRGCHEDVFKQGEKCETPCLGEYRLSLIVMFLASLTWLSFSGKQGGKENERSSRNGSNPNLPDQPDLTNAGSSLAAVLIDGESQTRISQPSGNFVPNVSLKLVASDLTGPMVAVSPDDGTKRLFIVDQIGVIKILEPSGDVRSGPFLDLRSKLIQLSPQYDERGLLGLAFHPNFRNNGRLFVYYSIPLRRGGPDGWDHTNRLSEYRVSFDPSQIATAHPAAELRGMQGAVARLDEFC